MRKRILVLLLCLVCLMAGGCSVSGQPDENRTVLVTAKTDGLTGESGTYALYFRLGDGDFLAREERKLVIARDETEEMALVRSLIDGPSATSADLAPLFPKGTQVLATAKQGNTLFVTLNEKFLTGYAAEKSDRTGEEKAEAIRRERQLCLDALAATLTDADLCARVQVLILRNQVQGHSMRLTEDFLLLNGSDMPLEPVVRREETIYTPYQAAKRVLTCWMNRNHSLLMETLSSYGRPSEQAMMDLMEESPLLTGFTLSGGTVSGNGKEAVVTAELILHSPHGERKLSGWPVRLRCENGVWKMTWDTLAGMMAEE